MKPMTRLLITVLAAAVLAGPAAALTEGCLRADRIDDFRNATRQSVKLSESGKDYLAEFQNACVGIEWANTIGVDAATQCLEEGDKVVYQDPGGMRQHCFIQTLTKIEKNPKTN
jgi:hypothetical protein